MNRPEITKKQNELIEQRLKILNEIDGNKMKRSTQIAALNTLKHSKQETFYSTKNSFLSSTINPLNHKEHEADKPTSKLSQYSLPQATMSQDKFLSESGKDLKNKTSYGGLIFSQNPKENSSSMTQPFYRNLIRTEKLLFQEFSPEQSTNQNQLMNSGSMPYLDPKKAQKIPLNNFSDLSSGYSGNGGFQKPYITSWTQDSDRGFSNHSNNFQSQTDDASCKPVKPKETQSFIKSIQIKKPDFDDSQQFILDNDRGSGVHHGYGATSTGFGFQDKRVAGGGVTGTSKSFSNQQFRRDFKISINTPISMFNKTSSQNFFQNDMYSTKSILSHNEKKHLNIDQLDSIGYQPEEGGAPHTSTNDVAAPMRPKTDFFVLNGKQNQSDIPPLSLHHQSPATASGAYIRQAGGLSMGSPSVSPKSHNPDTKKSFSSFPRLDSNRRFPLAYEGDSRNPSIYDKKVKQFLVLKDENFNLCTSKNMLRYCYRDIPFELGNMSELEAEQKLHELIETTRGPLGINSKKVFVFLKNGTQVDNILKIPITENTLIITMIPIFRGVLHVSPNLDMQQMLLKVIGELESMVNQDNEQNGLLTEKTNQIRQMNGRLTFEEKVAGKYSKVINNIIDTLVEGAEEKDSEQEEEGGNEDQDEKKQQQPQEILENQLNSKVLEALNQQFAQPSKVDVFKEIDSAFDYEVARKLKQKQSSYWRYTSSKQYRKSDDIIIKPQKVKLLEQIDEFYQNDMQQIQVHGIEQDDDEQVNYDDLKKKFESNSNPIRKIAGDMGIINESKKDQEDIRQEQLYRKLTILLSGSIDGDLEGDEQSNITGGGKTDTNIMPSTHRNYNKSEDEGEESLKDYRMKKKIAKLLDELINKEIMGIKKPKNKELKPEKTQNSQKIQSKKSIKSEKSSQKEIKQQNQQQEASVHTDDQSNISFAIGLPIQEATQEEEQKGYVLQKTQKAFPQLTLQLGGEGDDDAGNSSSNKDEPIFNYPEKIFRTQEDSKEDDDSDFLSDDDEIQQEEETALTSEDEEDGNGEINFEENDQEREFKKRVDHIKLNKQKVSTKKEVLTAIRNMNRQLFGKNIPKMMLEIPKMMNNKSSRHHNFNRYDMHQIYTIYKSLHEVTSQKYDDYNIEDGLDYEVYRNGLFQVLVQSEELAQRIFNTIDFNFSGFLNWEEFLKLMIVIRAKTVKEKINLFIKIADQNGDGALEWDEIEKLSKICLSKFISTESQEDTFLDELCAYFTQLIFDTVGQPDYKQGEIPFEVIKKAITEGGKDSDLLCMFCGADI